MTLPLRLDVLPPAQRQLWPELEKTKHEGFVLYGGTAVAIYLGHRESVDFNFFTDRSFSLKTWSGNSAFLEGAEVLQSQPNTLTAIARCGGNDTRQVKVSFFGGFGFGRLQDPQQTSDGVLEIASLQDLFAHKLKVLLQRVEMKDYLDVDALLNGGLDLAHGLAGARALFPAFAPQECLKALAYFNDPPLDTTLSIELQERLLNATKNIQTIPRLAVKSKTLGRR